MLSLAESLDVKALSLGDVMDLGLSTFPRGKHGIDRALLNEKVVVAVTNHVVLSDYFEVVHGLVKL